MNAFCLSSSFHRNDELNQGKDVSNSTHTKQGVNTAVESIVSGEQTAPDAANKVPAKFTSLKQYKHW